MDKVCRYLWIVHQCIINHMILLCEQQFILPERLKSIILKMLQKNNTQIYVTKE